MHTLIEKTRVKQRQHRCTGSQEYSFTTRTVDSDHSGDHSEDDNCHLCLIRVGGGDDIHRIVDKYLNDCS